MADTIRTTGPGPAAATDGLLLDALGRPLRDLRISVTDRCNFRCTYCMPKAVYDRDYRFLPHADLLSFEEITRIAAAFARRGVAKLRLTGGEPLLRKELERLVEMLAGLRDAGGCPLDVSLTTNAALLQRKARELRRAGLKRLTVSLDALDDTVFERLNGVGFPVAAVLEAIDAALAAGFAPVKLNMVVQRGINDDQIVPLARHVREQFGPRAILRFIEFMDVGTTNGWRMDDVVPSAEVLARRQRHWPLAALPARSAGETAQRWRYTDGHGEIGLISSVTQAFCRTCNRARLSIEGRLFTCLFATAGHDLRALLRGGATEAELDRAIVNLWQRRAERYSELRGQGLAPADSGQRRIEMHYIGG